MFVLLTSAQGKKTTKKERSSFAVDDVFTYNTMPKVCVDVWKPAVVELWYEELDKNIVTQTIVLIGYGKNNMFDKREKVLCSMLQGTNSKVFDGTMTSCTCVLHKMDVINMMDKWYEQISNVEMVSVLALYQNFRGNWPEYHH